jgi:rod shape determining protein RodA
MITTGRSIRDFDWPLILTAVALSFLGVLQIYSATRGTAWQESWWKQLLFIGMGIVAMFVISRIDYHTLLDQVPLFYILCVSGLIAVLLFGRLISGSRRWLSIGGVLNLQVSEFAKLMVVLLIARYLSELRSDHLSVGDLLKLGGLVGLPLGLILIEPDLGTTLTYVPILAIGIFLGGLRWRLWVALILITALVLPMSWFFLKDYQKARLMTFVDPDADPQGSGYQVIQSQVAVGSGGLWGKGVAQGSQTQLRFLPVPHTDFIMSAYAEEHGFVGVMVVLGLFFLLLMQIVQNAQMASDRAGLFICMGVAALLLFHLLVNVGMVIGRMPVTGIPLPLMSYGGSSILSFFMMLGLVNNVRLRRFVN